MPAALLLIMQYGQVVAALMPTGIAAVNGIIKIFAKNTNGFTVQVLSLQNGSVIDADTALKLIAGFEDSLKK